LILDSKKSETINCKNSERKRISLHESAEIEIQTDGKIGRGNRSYETIGNTIGKMKKKNTRVDSEVFLTWGLKYQLLKLV
jgi:hypothetical protein